MSKSYPPKVLYSNDSVTNLGFHRALIFLLDLDPSMLLGGFEPIKETAHNES